jgi:hypothetical protein
MKKLIIASVLMASSVVVYADNFTFIQESVSEIPVPAVLWLFSPALIGFLSLRRKSKLEA